MRQAKEIETKNPNAYNGEVLELDSKIAPGNKKMYTYSYGRLVKSQKPTINRV